MKTLLIIASLALVGCQQSKREALQLVCDAPLHASVRDVPSKQMRAVAIAKLLSASIKNREVSAMFDTHAMASPEMRDDILPDAIKSVGISTCPMLDQLKEN